MLEQSRAEVIYYVEEFHGNLMQEIADEVCREILMMQRRILLTDQQPPCEGHDTGRLPEVSPRDVTQI